MAKPYKTFREQAHILVTRGMQSSRGLSVDELEAEIENKLRYINYYRISAYWASFLETGDNAASPHFRPGTYWETVLVLYDFDRDLRELLFSAISQMELALRTQIAHQWSLYTHSSTPQASKSGMLASFLTRQEGVVSPHEKFMARIADNFRKDRPLYAGWDAEIKQGATIETVPVWSFVEFASFGHLAELLRCALEPELVQRIAEAMQFDSVEYFLFGISLLAQVRNACAHQFRVWNSRWLHLRFQDAPEPIRTELDRLAIPGSTAAALTFCCRMLRAMEPDNQWKQRLLQYYTTASETVPTLFRDLGFFSSSWHQDPRWNLT